GCQPYLHSLRNCRAMAREHVIPQPGGSVEQEEPRRTYEGFGLRQPSLRAAVFAQRLASPLVALFPRQGDQRLDCDVLAIALANKLARSIERLGLHTAALGQGPTKTGLSQAESHHLCGWHLLDHFVCNADHVGGEREPDCFGSLEINDHLEFARLDDRQIGGLLPFENPSRERCELHGLARAPFALPPQFDRQGRCNSGRRERRSRRLWERPRAASPAAWPRDRP